MRAAILLTVGLSNTMWELDTWRFQIVDELQFVEKVSVSGQLVHQVAQHGWCSSVKVGDNLR